MQTFCRCPNDAIINLSEFEESYRGQKNFNMDFCRFDFTILADQPIGNYWVRSETLEVLDPPHMAESILRYEGAPEEDPITTRRECTEDDKCQVC